MGPVQPSTQFISNLRLVHVLRKLSIGNLVEVVFRVQEHASDGYVLLEQGLALSFVGFFFLGFTFVQVLDLLKQRLVLVRVRHFNSFFVFIRGESGSLL